MTHPASSPSFLVRALLLLASVVAAAGCGGDAASPDGGVADTGLAMDGSLDLGEPDAGDADLGVADLGALDSDTSDLGATDGATDDAEVTDLGTDAGGCPDTDMDGVCNEADACTGNDSAGDGDSDGVCNDVDACTGNDGTGDSDTDGFCNDVDVCTGDDAAGDADMDDVCNDLDVCVGDDSTGDADMDGICADTDNCVAIFNPGQEDNDPPTGEGDACNVVFVRAGATGAGDGASWADAFTSVQPAVTAAQANLPGGPLKEIWIAEGTYRAAANTTVLAMVASLEVYGGFVGTEAQRSARPAVLRESVLSGDANGDDAPLTVATVQAERNAPNQPTRTDNASLVVLMATGARLDGVVVADGYTTAIQDGVGIRVPAMASEVVLHRVTARDNIGAVLNASGAGLSAHAGSAVEVSDSVFLRNIAWSGAGAEGLAGSTLTIQGTLFEANGTIGGQGTGVRSNSVIALEDCRFLANEMVGNGGGGVHTHGGGSGTLRNLLFDGNIGRRGAIQLSGSGVYTVTNVTIASTESEFTEGALWATANTSLVNVVFWNNHAGDLNSSASNLPGSVAHSCSTRDLTGFGLGNVLLDSSTTALGDPFSAGPAGQLFLKHMGAGDAVTSACVDAGMTSTDPDAYFPDWSSLTTRADGVLDGANSDAIDMGYHYAP